MDLPDLPTEPGCYAELADGFLYDLREDGKWYGVGRALPFGGLDLDPDANDRGLTPEQIRQGGAYPTERIEPPDYPLF